ncbi:PEFG-CTERM sorting domain-containing protein [Nitrosopumilus sp.]|uniref:PEFG-CTERM sorting domain-containing protein n=1 Tax=Nitrosopumilus sp. TaxID=2024843 RepID=UPI002636121F|nr:PEFG-CTERM sorting domain-containing protein [Nitrosopumilus sp.]
MMLSVLTVFSLCMVLIAILGQVPAFAEGTILVTTDKASYTYGEPIFISGEIKDIDSVLHANVIVTFSDGSLAALKLVPVDADKKFNAQIIAGDSMTQIGTYTVTVQYGAENYSSTTSFEFEGPLESFVFDSSNAISSTVLVRDYDDLIKYEITGGKLLEVFPDVDAKSLIVSIDAINSGYVTLTIHRLTLDATINGQDHDFFVLIDGEEADFDEIKSSTDRVLTIAFPAGAEEIEIIGTFVVPEFGTIAAMILAVAIISIIAISTKSRLCIVSRC